MKNFSQKLHSLENTYSKNSYRNSKNNKLVDSSALVDMIITSILICDPHKSPGGIYEMDATDATATASCFAKKA